MTAPESLNMRRCGGEHPDPDANLRGCQRLRHCPAVELVGTTADGQLDVAPVPYCRECIARHRGEPD